MEEGRLNRRGFLALTGAASLGALFAACGGNGEAGAPATTEAPPETEAPPATTEEAPPATTEEAPPATTEEAPAGPTFDPESEPDGPIEVFEWVGYDNAEDTAAFMWKTYDEGPYGQKSPLKFTFLENDQQALAKVASGYSPALIHPCIAYWRDFHAAGLVQPFDTALLPDYEGIPEAIRAGGVGDDGLVYHVPFDIGFSTLTYRADKIQISPEEESWSILLNPEYEGKIGIFSDDIAIIKIGALINAGEPINPNQLTTEQIQAAKETMIKAKPQIRTFWGAQADTVNDFVNGNLWATYTWPDGYWSIKNHEKMKDVEVRYMWPKEGRLAWVCGLVLHAQTEQPGRATMAVAATNTPAASAALTDVYQYGGAQQAGVQELVQNKELIAAFSLDDPTAFAPPRAWFEEYLPNRKEYVDAAAEVKAA
ncbi:MAG: extracellular solute-binding protein [Thermoleophilia bacterium]|nr:extracellular solute-binding protein [Thermoleophilia bacterium]